MRGGAHAPCAPPWIHPCTAYPWIIPLEITFLLFHSLHIKCGTKAHTSHGHTQGQTDAPGILLVHLVTACTLNLACGWYCISTSFSDWISSICPSVSFRLLSLSDDHQQKIYKRSHHPITYTGTQYVLIHTIKGNLFRHLLQKFLIPSSNLYKNSCSIINVLKITSFCAPN